MKNPSPFKRKSREMELWTTSNHGKKELRYMSPDEFINFTQRQYITDYLNEPGSRSLPSPVRPHSPSSIQKRFINSSAYRKMLKRGEGDDYSVNDFKEMFLAGVKVDPPVLVFDRGIPVDHEGRHRALAAKGIGMKKIPVIIVNLDREYSRSNPKNMTFYQKLPHDPQGLPTGTEEGWYYEKNMRYKLHRAKRASKKSILGRAMRMVRR